MPISMHNWLKRIGLLLVVVFGLWIRQTVSLAVTPPTSKPKTYDGIITQFNAGDNSFVLRLRDGSLMTIQNPLPINSFVSFTGVAEKGILEQVSAIKIKGENATDTIPEITSLDPGSGQVNTKITLVGRGFTKNNSISIGTVKNAIVNLASKDGKTLHFQLPPIPCDKKMPKNCSTTVLQPGSYDIAVTNQNGLSNLVPFGVAPLPPLEITTETLPQVVGGTRYQMAINAIGGAQSYVWLVSQGKLPPGLTLQRGICRDTPCRVGAIIYGIPTTPGTYQFTVTLYSGSEKTSRDYVIKVVQPLSDPGY